MNPPTKRLTFGIMNALVVWGIILAIGATGVFIQDSMLDIRKSVIVVVCVALFLGLWGIVLFGRKQDSSIDSQPQANASDSSSASKLPWSRAGLATFALGVSGSVLWAVAIAIWNGGRAVAEDSSTNWMVGTTVVGWLAALCILGAATAGMISLSQPVKRRGKWIGLLGLLGFAAAFIAFVARMSP